MKSRIGVVCLVISYLLAFTAILNVRDDFWLALRIFVFYSFPLHLLGCYLQLQRDVFFKKIIRLSVIYVSVIMIPLILFQYEYYYKVKESVFRDEQFLVFRGRLKNSIVGLEIFLGVGGILFIFIRLFSDIKRKYIASLLSIACFTTYGVIQALTWAEYEGIHEEKGIVYHYWNGKEKQVGWDELEAAVVVPYVHYGRLSDHTDETQFVWALVFVTKSGEQIVFNHYAISDYHLEENQIIKKKVMKEGLVFHVQEMSDKAKDWYNFDLELEKVDPKPYHEFFQVK